VGDTARQAYEAIGNSFGKGGEKAQQAGSEAQRMRDTGARKADQAGEEAYRKGQQAYGQASRQAGEAKERVYQKGEAVGDRGRQMGQQAQQYARDVGGQAADYGRQVYEDPQRAGGQMYHQATENAEYGYDRAAENAQYARDKIREAASNVYEKASEAGSKVTEPVEHAAEGAKNSWGTLTERVRQWLPGSHDSQQARDSESLENRVRAMVEQSLEDTRKFWRSMPPFDPTTMDPAEYVADFQREMAYHYGTMAAVPRLQLTEVRTVVQPSKVDQVTAPASLLFLPLLALLATWMARRVHVRRRRSHEQHRTTSEKQGAVVAHQGSVTPSTAMDANYDVMTALSTSLYAASSIIPLVAAVVTLLECNGVSPFLVTPLYLMLLMGTVMHVGESIREGASRELPGGSGREGARPQRLQDIMGLSPGEWMLMSALGVSGLMAGYNILLGKPFALWS